jgi:hypothetical protein
MSSYNKEALDLIRQFAGNKPITFNSIYIKLTGSVTAALFLSQAAFLSSTHAADDGWFKRTRDEWEDEIGLSRREQEIARKTLKQLGLLEESLHGIPATLSYRVSFEEIHNKLRELRNEAVNPPVGTDVTNLLDNPPVGTDVTNLLGVSVQTNRGDSERSEKEEEDKGNSFSKTVRPPGKVVRPNRRRVAASGNPEEETLNALSTAMGLQPISGATRKNLLKLIQKSVITPAWAKALGFALKTYNEDRGRWKPLVPFIPFTPEQLALHPVEADNAIVKITDVLWEEVNMSTEPDRDEQLEEMEAHILATMKFEDAAKQ